MIHDEAALPSEPVPEGEGGTDGAARITRRRLHIDAPKGSRPPYLAIGNGVHRAPASQRDIGQTGTTLQRLDQIEKRLFVHGLDRPCDVPMAVEQGIFSAAARTQELFERGREQVVELRRAGRPLIGDRLPVMTKVFQVELEAIFHAHDLAHGFHA